MDAFNRIQKYETRVFTSTSTKSNGESQEEATGKRVGLGLSRTTCQGYDTQMLLIRKTLLESYGPALTRKTNEEAYVSQSD